MPVATQTPRRQLFTPTSAALIGGLLAAVVFAIVVILSVTGRMGSSDPAPADTQGIVALPVLPASAPLTAADLGDAGFVTDAVAYVGKGITDGAYEALVNELAPTYGDPAQLASTVAATIIFAVDNLDDKKVRIWHSVLPQYEGVQFYEDIATGKVRWVTYQNGQRTGLARINGFGLDTALVVAPNGLVPQIRAGLLAANPGKTFMVTAPDGTTNMVLVSA